MTGLTPLDNRSRWNWMLMAQRRADLTGRHYGLWMNEYCYFISDCPDVPGGTLIALCAPADFRVS